PGRNESRPARICACELATWESERMADRRRFEGNATASRVPRATTPVVAESRWRFCVRLVTALCIGAAIETLRALDGFSGCLCTRDTRHGCRPPDSAHCRQVQQGYGAPTMHPRRVLPTPGGPVRVTRRTSSWCSRWTSAVSSYSRPISGVGGLAR